MARNSTKQIHDQEDEDDGLSSETSWINFDKQCGVMGSINLQTWNHR